MCGQTGPRGAGSIRDQGVSNVKRNVLGGRRAVILIFAVLLLGGLLWGLTSALAESGSPAPASAPPATSGKITLRVGWTRDADNMNVFLGYSASSFAIWYLNYDGLVGMNAADLSPSKETGLATDWSSSPDGKTWTFKLRENAVWHDGVPVTAKDVAFSYNYTIDNDMYNWSSYTKLIKHATAIDDYTVEMVCSDPKPSILNSWIPIIPEHIWSKVSPEDAEGNYKVKYPMVGSGPFQVQEWKKGDFLRMSANKDYWRGAPVIDEILFQTYTNADSMSQELKAGTIDACTGMLAAQVKQFQATDDGIEAESVPVNGYDELGFNCYADTSLGHPVLRDWKFRQALQWAVDHQAISDIAYGGQARPADTVNMSDYYDNPDWHWTPPAETAYTFDLEKAKAALEAAGYTDSDGNGIREYKGKDIELRLNPRAESTESVQAAKLMSGWFEQVGLKINLQTLDEGSLVDKMYNTVDGVFTPDYDMFLWGWYNDIDPSIGLDYFTKAQINGWSDCAWWDPEYEKLQVAAVKELDITKRKEMIDRQQQILYEQSPYIVMVYSNDIEGWNTAKWEGWIRSPAVTGNVVFPPYGNDTYLEVHPKVAGESESSSSNTTLYIIIGVVAAVVVIVLIMVLRRSKPKSVEE